MPFKKLLWILSNLPEIIKNDPILNMPIIKKGDKNKTPEGKFYDVNIKPLEKED